MEFIPNPFPGAFSCACGAEVKCVFSASFLMQAFSNSSWQLLELRASEKYAIT